MNILQKTWFTIKSNVEESTILWFSLFVAFAMGAFLIFIYHEWKTLLGEPWAEIVRDLGIAFCISALIAVMIEIGLARKLSSNVLDATMRRIVPPEVWEEIRQHIISQPITRERFVLTMSIPQHKDGEECVSHTTLQYDTVGWQDALTFDIEHELDVHRNPQGTGPKADRFKVIQKGNPGSSEYVNYVGDKLNNILSENGLVLKLPVEFKHHKDKVPIKIVFHEALHAPDIVNWWMSAATVEPEFVVDDLPSNLNVVIQAHHPKPTLLTPMPSSNRHWKFHGVMLPGQGVEFRFSKV
jgi:hypothetical protein